MKKLLKVLIGVGVVLTVLLVMLALFAGHIVKSAVNTAGPKVLGVPISLKGVNVSLLSGSFGLDELVIGNPEGFKTPEAIRVNKVKVDVKMASLFSRVLVIDRIYVSEPEITYEVGLNGSNIGAIQDKAASAKQTPEQPEPADKSAKPTKKVLINDFLIEGGKINVSTIGMVGHSATIPLPSIHLADIGKESDGATLSEVLAKVFGTIGGVINGAVTGIGEGAGAIGKGAMDAGKAVGSTAADAGKTVGQGAVDAGKAVGEGVNKAMESVGGMLK